MTGSRTATHPSLSIVVPLYNEEAVLPSLVGSVLEALGDDPGFLELVLVDDGSKDSTTEIAQSLAAVDSRIKLLRHEKNRGLGGAIRTGLAAAEGELVLYTDADLPFDFKLIPTLVGLATPNSVVTGCRANRGEGGRRWLLSKGYNLICHYLLGLRVTDVNFACKLFPRRAAKAMRLEAEGSFIDAEMLLECLRLGFSITEAPLTYFPRTAGESTLSRPAVVIGILSEMIGYFRRRTVLGYEIAEENNPQR